MKAQRRGLRAESKRLDRDLKKIRGDVQRLVGALTRTTGTAAEAVRIELEKAQERVGTLEARQQDVQIEQNALDAQQIDQREVAHALESFDPIWDVLATPEKERVLQLLIDQVHYNGGSQELEIVWQLGGFGELAQEIGE